jgi:hypothetical protein
MTTPVTFQCSSSLLLYHPPPACCPWLRWCPRHTFLPSPVEASTVRDLIKDPRHCAPLKIRNLNLDSSLSPPPPVLNHRLARRRRPVRHLMSPTRPLALPPSSVAPSSPTQLKSIRTKLCRTALIGPRPPPALYCSPLWAGPRRSLGARR